MNDIKVGDRLEIHCYKHNGKLHRQWDEAVVLEIKDDYIVFGNNKTTVVDSDGRVWKTKEPAIMFFYKDRWITKIGQLKAYGINFYCNIATPYIIDEKVIDSSSQIYGTILNTQTMEHARAYALSGCKRIMTIENKANYEDMSYRKDTLYIF